MTSINMSIPRPGNERGEVYHQKSFQSADLTTASVAVVPAVTGKLAVIDKLVISFGGAQTFQLLAGTDELLDGIYGAANTTVASTPVHRVISLSMSSIITRHRPQMRSLNISRDSGGITG